MSRSKVIKNMATRVADGTKAVMRQHLDEVPESKAAWTETFLKRTRCSHLNLLCFLSNQIMG